MTIAGFPWGQDQAQDGASFRRRRRGWSDLCGFIPFLLAASFPCFAFPACAKEQAATQPASSADEKTLTRAQSEFSSALQQRTGHYTMLFMAGRHAQATRIAEEALTYAIQVLGPDGVPVAQILNDLGHIYHLQGEEEKAAALHTRALEIRARALGLQDAAVLQSMTNLAAVYQAQGDYAHAQPFLKQSLALVERQLGPNNPWVAQLLDRLAVTQSAQGQAAEAGPLFDRALAILRQQESPTAPSEADVLDHYAQSLHRAGKDAQAKTMEIRAHDLREAASAPNRLAPQPADPTTHGRGSL